ncbi:MAG: isopeptide-forming domain-containing fimbrial protein [Subdoligranulum sp.]|nr:isopeptide-forming domain-containing fimbrial protein [Subdoligranulum sp.]
METAGTDSGYIVDKSAEYVFEITEDKTVAIPTDATNKNDYKLSDGKLVINNYRPDLDKKVKNRETGAYEDDSDYSVGDIIPYEITVGVPGNITKLATFVVTDTPTNLHFVNGTGADALVIKCGDDTVPEKAYTVTPDTAADDVAAGFKIAFVPNQMETYAGKDLVISYKAELLASAKSDLAENVGNPNTAKLEYTNKIGTDGTEESNGKGEIGDSATVYTFMIKIVKKKDSTDGDVMSGVVFDLYKEYNDGEADKLPSGAKAIADADATELGLTVTKVSIGQDLVRRPRMIRALFLLKAFPTVNIN